ncbi:TniQ family protein [Kordiimonas sp. SCSIO 12610]|uniref:TniQ family protein n=1 Tax=Kordiimonas sp. SCSIO 12610 TaxID=2829597 RepID=UPI00210D96A7|nr:TniQ family protein [Kordiimonas sp. SCSIO 12610]UTW54820.1 TniQ family protein [Kordiimonas sp. SCSIO 12610]
MILNKHLTLPLVDAPKPFENVPGYVMRLSELNRYEKPRWIYSLLSEKDPIMSFAFVREAVSSLSKILDGFDDEVVAITYARSNTSRYQNISFGRFGDMPASLFDLQNPKICPDCVQETGAISSVWDLRFYHVCSRHKCYLIDRCQRPGCGGRLTWWRSKVGVCNKCDEPFTHALNNKAPSDHMLAFSEFIERGWPMPYSADAEIDFNCGGYKYFWRTVLLLAERLLATDDSIGKLMPTSASNIADAIANALFDWPNNFEDYLRQLLKWDARGGNEFSLRNDTRFGRLYHRIVDEPGAQCFRHLRDSVEHFIYSSEYCSRITGRGGHSLHEASKIQEQFLTRSEVKERLSMSSARVIRLFNDGTFTGHKIKMGDQHVYRIETKSVERFEESQ